MKGALHVHSTYSDGQHELAELRELYLRDGCRFVCLADHAKDMTEDRLRDYVRDCRELSDDRLLLVPGLEFDCERRVHLVGFGVTSPCGATGIAAVLRHVRDAGGVAVLAHPRDGDFAWIEALPELPDGIEVWNSKYDGKHAPRGGTFRLLRRLQARRPDIRAFYGQDLHWRTQFHELYTLIQGEELSREAILAALARGAFTSSRGELRLPADGVVPDEVLARLDRVHRRADLVRSALDTVNRARRRAGVGVPRWLEAELRRIL